jgi:MFS family permease
MSIPVPSTLPVPRAADGPGDPSLPPDSDRTRRDLAAFVADGVAFSIMVGCGETYIPAFLLALGLGPVTVALMATAPAILGASVQLGVPWLAARIGSHRRLVLVCTSLQAASFMPLAYWAWIGRAEPGPLFVVVSLYWASGMATSPAWTAWIGSIVPASIRTGFFAGRNRLAQAGVLAGFVAGGLLLEAGRESGRELRSFAVLFGLAAAARMVSTLCLATCGERVRPTMQLGRAAGLSAEGAAGPGRRPLLLDGRYTSMLGYLWVLSASAQFAAPFFTPYMLQELGFSYGTYMVIVATSLAAKSLALPRLGRLASRIGSVGLLSLGGLSLVPLSLLWLVSVEPAWLVGVQVVAGVCWAAYELAVCLLFFDEVPEADRAAVTSSYTFGLAWATVTGAAAGGLLLDALGEDRTAYLAVFAASSLLRVATLPLLVAFRRRARTARRPPTAHPAG